MIKCTFKDKQFKTYGKCTVCILKASIPVPAHFPSKAEKWMRTHPSISAEYGYGCVNFTVVGKSKCAPDDTFNPTTGMRLAESRAKSRAYRFCYTLCNMAAVYYDSYLVEYADAMLHFSTYNNKETEHQSEILASNESC